MDNSSCIAQSIVLIKDIKRLLISLPDDVLTYPLEVYEGSTLGGHFRHIYEFFQTVVKADNLIDYTLRLRNVDIESRKQIAIRSFEEIEYSLTTLDERKQVWVRPDFKERSERMVASSIGRELVYAYDHAVHHLALIRIGLYEIMPEMVVDPSIGVAASTLQHKKINYDPK